jgi:hypothetical protein
LQEESEHLNLVVALAEEGGSRKDNKYNPSL